MAWLNGSSTTDNMRSFFSSAGCPVAGDGTVTLDIPDDMEDKLKSSFWRKYPLCDDQGGCVGGRPRIVINV